VATTPRRGPFSMKRSLFPASAIMAMLSLSCGAQAQGRAQYESLIATHARANSVPEALVHRVIVRESKYRPDVVGRGGTIGLMQIKLATARGVGYTGDASGLRDPDTNLAYGVKYLAGAWRAADGNHDRAMRYYASGYYYAAKQQRLERTTPATPQLASAPPQEVAKPKEAARKPLNIVPKEVLAKPKPASKKLTEAKAEVPKPPPAIAAGVNNAEPR
jgi:soluble lytic murein transglycosylase-like protein